MEKAKSRPSRLGRTGKFLILGVIFAGLALFAWWNNRGEPKTDLLVYTNGSALMMFDPQTEETTEIGIGLELPDYVLDPVFSLSSTGNLIFASAHEGFAALYFVNVQDAEHELRRIQTLNSEQEDEREQYRISRSREMENGYIWEWSPDGRYLSLLHSSPDDAISGNSLHVWDSASDTYYELPLFWVAGKVAHRWSPTGEQLAFISADADTLKLHIFDLRTLQTTEIGIVGWHFYWSPDGQYLVFNTYQDGLEERISIWDGTTTTDITPNVPIDDVSYFTWSQDNRLAFVVGDGTEQDDLYLWDGGETVNISQDPTRLETEPIWSPDGQLAFQSTQGENTLMFIWDGVSMNNDLPDEHTYTQIEVNGRTTSSSWSPDGSLFFTSHLPNHETGLLVWDGDKITQFMQSHIGYGSLLSWSPKGDWQWVNMTIPHWGVWVRSAENENVFGFTMPGNGYGAPPWSLVLSHSGYEG